MCGINAVGAQGRGCSSLLCHAHLKMGVLLHKQATVRFILILSAIVEKHPHFTTKLSQIKPFPIIYCNI